MENNCLTALYLVMILTKVTKKDPEKVEFSAMKEIYKLVQVKRETASYSLQTCEVHIWNSITY